MKFILGTKQYMTQVFDGEGRVRPGTVLSALPNFVLALKSEARDGYGAVLIGSEEKDVKRAKKSHLGAIRKSLGEDKAFRHLKEFRLDIKDSESGPYKVGDKIDVSTFSVGDDVVVTGISKGKGFQGVVKRHGFAGGSRTHGQKHSEREAGSIGGGGRAGGRVVKGMRMAGRMGSDTVTVKGLKVLAIDPENNQILISGAIPGRRGTVVSVRSSK